MIQNENLGKIKTVSPVDWSWAVDTGREAHRGKLN